MSSVPAAAHLKLVKVAYFETEADAEHPDRCKGEAAVREVLQTKLERNGLLFDLLSGSELTADVVSAAGLSSRRGSVKQARSEMLARADTREDQARWLGALSVADAVAVPGTDAEDAVESNERNSLPDVRI